VKEGCAFCDVVHEELRDGRRVIQENADIVALAPYAPRFAFETWLLPRRHGARFEDAPRHEYESLARTLKSVLQRMDRALEAPPYNLIVHTSPFSEETGDFYHWHLEIMPKLTRVAGFEWGTGFYLNLTTTNALVGGAYTATAIRGLRTGVSVSGLYAPGAFLGNDNKLSPVDPFIDFAGISYLAGGIGLNLYNNGICGTNQDYELASGSGCGAGLPIAFDIRPLDTTAVPEPATLTMVGLGLAAARRRRVHRQRRRAGF